jgi:hypothetical protein
MALWLPVAIRQRHGPHAAPRDSRKRGGGFLPIAQVRIGQETFVSGPLILRRDDQNPIGVLIRVRFQQNTIDDAENSSVQTDAEPQAQYRHDGERFAVPERSNCVPNVLEEHVLPPWFGG